MAEFIKADALWPKYTGASMGGQISIFETKGAFTNEILFGNRVKNSQTHSTKDLHATSVSGVLLSSETETKGVAFNLPSLTVYSLKDLNLLENGLGLISSHSYGREHGWEEINGTSTWFGGEGNTEDASFAKYGFFSRYIDKVANTNLSHLAVISAGNHRDNRSNSMNPTSYQIATTNGVRHVLGISFSNEFKSNTSSFVPSPDNQKGDFFTIGSYKTSKNSLIVGSINEDKKSNLASSFGPTIDGRIKPDVVTLGTNVNLIGYDPESNGAFSFIGSGTSFSAPAVAGGALLLQEAFNDLNTSNVDTFMLATTLKTLLIHTADRETYGPDFKTGWGSVNLETAYNIIQDKSSSKHSLLFEERALINGTKDLIPIQIPPNTEFKATMVWNDPISDKVTNDPYGFPDGSLVNDLDMSLHFIDDTPTAQPFIKLFGTTNENNATASTGDDDINNVEQIRYLNDSNAPKRGYLKISHEGEITSLFGASPEQSGTQPYSLIVTGIESRNIEITNINANSTLLLDQPHTFNIDITGNINSVDISLLVSSNGIITGDKNTAQKRNSSNEIILVNNHTVTAGANTYEWIPSNLTPGSNYTIRISDATNQSINDVSETFNIISGTPCFPYSIQSFPSLLWPLEGYQDDYKIIRNTFGDEWVFGSCGEAFKKHTGIDIDIKNGSIVGKGVYASESGIVKAHFARNPWRGNVTIEHSLNGITFTTNYNHIDIDPSITLGQSISKGQQIGIVTDLATRYKDHLHYSIRLGAYTNISNKGALPQIDITSCTCNAEPLFPEYFIDPNTLTFQDYLDLYPISQINNSNFSNGNKSQSRSINGSDILMIPYNDIIESALEVGLALRNNGNKSINAYFAVSVHDSIGRHINDLDLKYQDLDPGDTVILYNPSYYFLPGNYKIYAKYSYDNIKWHIIERNGFTNPQSLIVNPNYEAIDGYSLRLFAPMSITDPLALHSSGTISLQIENIGKKYFHGKLHLLLKKGPGEVIELSFNNTVLIEGITKPDSLKKQTIQINYNDLKSAYGEGPYELYVVAESIFPDDEVSLIGINEFHPRNITVYDPALTNANIILPTNELSFGSVTLGNSLTQEFQICNSNVSSLNLNGTIINSSAEVSVTPQSFNIPPNECGLFTVTFSPTQEGVLTTKLDITHNGLQASPQIFSLIGEGYINDICNNEPNIVTDITPATCGKTGQILWWREGGVAPFSYQWSTKKDGSPQRKLAAGTYHLSVTDGNNCITVFDFEVPQAGTMSGVAYTDNANCFTPTGKVDIDVEGGILPYKYKWSTNCGSSSGCNTNNECCNLYPGEYEVTVTDASRCELVIPYTIESDGLEPQISNFELSDVSCFGYSDGEVNFNITGGQAPYQYSIWYPNSDTYYDYFDYQDSAVIENLFARDDYRINILDANGCLFRHSFVVCEPDPLNVYPIIEDGQCNEYSKVDLSIIGGTVPYQIIWSNGDSSMSTYLPEGQFRIKVSDSIGCSETKIFETTIYNDVQASFNYHTTNLDIDFINNSKAASSHKWYVQDSLFSTAKYTKLTLDSFGIYNICLVAENACSSDSICKRINIATPITSSSFTRLYQSDYSASAVDFEIANNGGMVLLNEISLDYGVKEHVSNLNSKDILIRKIADSGDIIWSKTFGSPYQDEASKIIALDDGNYLVSGYSIFDNPLEESNIFVAKINPFGDIVWYKRFDSAGYTRATNMIKLQNGNILISGWGATGESFYGNRNMVLICMDQDGNHVWSKIVGTSNQDIINAIEQKDNGDILLVGYRLIDNNFKNRDITIYTISEEGEFGNSYVYNSALVNESEIAIDAKFKNNSLYIHGFSNESFTHPFTLDKNLLFIKLDSNLSIDRGKIFMDSTFYTLSGNGKIDVDDSGDAFVLLNKSSGNFYKYDDALDSIVWYKDYIGFNGIELNISDDKSTLYGASEYATTVIKLDSLQNSQCGQLNRHFDQFDITNQIQVSNINITNLSVTLGYIPQYTMDIVSRPQETYFTEKCPNCEASVQITNTIDNICIGDSIKLQSAKAFVNQSVWLINQDTASYSSSYWFKPDSLGTDTIQLIGSNGLSSCRDTSTLYINVHESNSNTFSYFIDSLSCNNSADAGIIIVPDMPTDFYKFQWSTGDTTSNLQSLSAGIYEVNIFDSLGCRTFESFNIPSVSPISINEYIQNTTCGFNTGAISLNVTNSQGQETYHWASGQSTSSIDNLYAGEYSVSVTDSVGCTISQTIEVHNHKWRMIKTIDMTGIEGTSDLDINSSNLFVNRQNGSLSSVSLDSLVELNYNDDLFDTSYTEHKIYLCPITGSLNCPSDYIFQSTHTSNGTLLTKRLISSLDTVEVITVDSIENLGFGRLLSGVIALYLVENSVEPEKIHRHYVSDLSYRNSTTLSPNYLHVNHLENEAYAGSRSVWLSFEDSNVVRRRKLCEGGSQSGCTTGGTLFTTSHPVTSFKKLGNQSFPTINCGGYDFTNGNIILVASDDNNGNGILERYAFTNIACQGVRVDSLNSIPDQSIMELSENEVFLISPSEKKLQIRNRIGLDIIETISLPFEPFDAKYDSTNLNLYISSLDTNVIYVYKNESPFVSQIFSNINLCDTIQTASLYTSNYNGIDSFDYVWSTGSTSDTILVPTGNSYSVTVTDGLGCQYLSTSQVDSITPLSILPISFPEYCDSRNGSAIVNINGGYFPYEITWNNGFISDTITNLSAGNYYVTVTDDVGCIKIDSISLLDTAYTFDVYLDIDKPICDTLSGRIEAIVDGGIAPYTYYWNNGSTTYDITSIKKGLYSVDVLDSNDCIITIDTFINCINTYELSLFQKLDIPEHTLVVDSVYILSGSLYNLGPENWYDSLYCMIGNDSINLLNLGYYEIPAYQYMPFNEEIMPKLKDIGSTVPISILYYGTDTVLTQVGNNYYDNPIFRDICEGIDADFDGYIECLDCDDNDPNCFPNQVWHLDFDRDGYGVGDSLNACFPPVGYRLIDSLYAVTGDCDDQDSLIYPGTQNIVSSLTDYGPGSIIRVLECALPGDTIYFHPDLNGDTILLLQYTIDIEKEINFIDSTSVVINANGIGIALRVDENANVLLEGLSLISGNKEGGGIYNNGNITSRNVEVGQNQSNPVITVINNGSIIVEGFFTIDKTSY